MDRFDDKDIANQCMVKGCESPRDPGSTQHLCRLCYDVMTTGDVLKYHANYMGKNWIYDTAMKIFHIREDNKELEEHNEYLEGVIKELKQEVKDLEDDRDNAYFLADGSTLSVNDLRTFYHENKALKEGHKRKDEYIDNLRKEIEALNYNIDHAYKDGDKFLTVDDLYIFYQENKNVHDVVQQQHNRILLLGLELKALQKPKNETFATKTEEEFAERARINQEKQNVKFEGYTEGFWKGFDMGYSKAWERFDG